MEIQGSVKADDNFLTHRLPPSCPFDSSCIIQLRRR